MSETTDQLAVLNAIDRLRRELGGYHGQLKAHNDLQTHCDRQRKRIAELEAIHARDKDENDKLRELVLDMWFWHYLGHIDAVSQEKQMEHIEGVLNRIREFGIEAE